MFIGKRGTPLRRSGIFDRSDHSERLFPESLSTIFSEILFPMENFCWKKPPFTCGRNPNVLKKILFIVWNI